MNREQLLKPSQKLVLRILRERLQRQQAIHSFSPCCSRPAPGSSLEDLSSPRNPDKTARSTPTLKCFSMPTLRLETITEGFAYNLHELFLARCQYIEQQQKHPKAGECGCLSATVSRALSFPALNDGACRAFRSSAVLPEA